MLPKLLPRGPLVKGSIVSAPMVGVVPAKCWKFVTKFSDVDGARRGGGRLREGSRVGCETLRRGAEVCREAWGMSGEAEREGEGVGKGAGMGGGFLPTPALPAPGCDCAGRLGVEGRCADAAVTAPERPDGERVSGPMAAGVPVKCLEVRGEVL